MAKAYATTDSRGYRIISSLGIGLSDLVYDPKKIQEDESYTNTPIELIGRCRLGYLINKKAYSLVANYAIRKFEASARTLVYYGVKEDYRKQWKVLALSSVTLLENKNVVKEFASLDKDFDIGDNRVVKADNEDNLMATTPKRRVRVKKSAVSMSSKDKTSLNDLVDEYAQAQKVIEEKQREQERILPLLHEKMRSCGVKIWATEHGEGERFFPPSRSSTVIDKEAFRERVNDEDFMSCISVSITKAKNVLSGKELESISDKTTPPKKPESVRVKVFKS